MLTLYQLYQQPWLIIGGLLILTLWTLIWKGLALWYSAKNKQKVWFIILLIFNTVGVLELIYLIFFKPRKLRSVGEVAQASQKSIVKKEPVKKKETRTKSKTSEK